MLISLDMNKSIGPDGISANVLIETAASILPSPTKLFNISIVIIVWNISREVQVLLICFSLV